MPLPGCHRKKTVITAANISTSHNFWVKRAQMLMVLFATCYLSHVTMLHADVNHVDHDM